MKLLISESQLKTLNELGGQFKEETEIIYRDNNIVCLIPKSQMSSRMFGKGANWCSNSKHGFDQWSKYGLLVRFIFRGGKKIRFTYYFKRENNDDFNWANENGYHTLFGKGSPFEVKSTDSKFSNESDILTHIKLIPDECKKRVLDFIKKNKKQYNYCYRNEDYKTPKNKKIEDTYKLIYQNYDKKLTNMGYYIFYHGIKNVFEILNTNTHETDSFRDIDSFQRKITEILMHKKTPEGV